MSSTTTLEPSLDDGAELEQQCLDLLNQTSIYDKGKYCPGTWDTWVCWPDTPAGDIARQPCPSFIVGFDPTSKFLFLKKKSQENERERNNKQNKS